MLLPFVLVSDDLAELGWVALASVHLVRAIFRIVFLVKNSELVVWHSHVWQFQTEPRQWFGQSVDGLQYAERVALQQLLDCHSGDECLVVRTEENVNRAEDNRCDREVEWQSANHSSHHCCHPLSQNQTRNWLTQCEY